MVSISQTVIFDLDGTILNTISDLGNACNVALVAYGYPTHTLTELTGMVGNGINKLLERALPVENRCEVEVMRLRHAFVAHYNEHCCEQTYPYPDMRDTLLQLKQRGYRLAVASNKYNQATQHIVAHYYPSVFEVVVGEQTDIPRKPEPVMVDTILGRMGLNRQNLALFVGDSMVDIDTARGVGVKVAVSTWGFVAPEILRAAHPDYMLRSPRDLLDILP